jgi:hypothetical protein
VWLLLLRHLDQQLPETLLVITLTVNAVTMQAGVKCLCPSSSLFVQNEILKAAMASTGLVAIIASEEDDEPVCLLREHNAACCSHAHTAEWIYWLLLHDTHHSFCSMSAS